MSGGVFGDSLGGFRDGVFCKFTWKEESHSSLDFPRGDGALLVHLGQFGRLGGNTLKDIINKGVHDAHGL